MKNIPDNSSMYPEGVTNDSVKLFIMHKALEKAVEESRKPTKGEQKND